MSKLPFIASILWSLAVSSALFAQLPPHSWTRFLGGNGIESGAQIIQTFDGGFAIVGSTASINWGVDNTVTDIFLIKFDKDGNHLWDRTYGGTASDSGYGIIQTQDSGFAIAGDTYSTDGDVTGNHGGSDAWIVRVDKDGNLLWQKCLGGSKRESLSKIIQDPNGNFIAIGVAESTNGDVIGHRGKTDIWMVKLNPLGHVVWKNCYGGTEEDGASILANTQQASLVYTGGGITFATSTKSSNVDVESRESNDTSQYDLWLVRLTDAGAIEWERCLGTEWHEIPHELIRTRDSGYAITGEFFGPDSTGYILANGMIVKTDASGTLVWQKHYGIPLDDDGFYSIIETNEGLITSGYANVGILGKFDKGWICVLNDTGSVIADTSIGAVSRKHRILSLTGVSGGGFGLTGHSERNSIDIWVSKFAAKATVDPMLQAILNVYPNPATDAIKVQYVLESGATVQMELMNVHGAIVHSRTMYHSDGRYENVLPISSLTAGIYLLRLNVGKNVYSCRVLVVK